MAVLAGDSLIIMAFEALAAMAVQDPVRSSRLVLTLARLHKSWLPRLTGSCYILPHTGTGDRQGNMVSR